MDTYTNTPQNFMQFSLVDIYTIEVVCNALDRAPRLSVLTLSCRMIKRTPDRVTAV